MMLSGTASDRPTDLQREDTVRTGANVRPFAAARVAMLAGPAAAIIERVFVLPIQQYLGACPVVVFQSIPAGRARPLCLQRGTAGRSPRRGCAYLSAKGRPNNSVVTGSFPESGRRLGGHRS
jgi:hypothetical protein